MIRYQFIILFFSISFVFSQSKIDFTDNEYHTITNFCYIEKEEVFDEKKIIKDTTIKHANFHNAHVLLKNGDYERSFSFILKALQGFEKSKDTLGMFYSSIIKAKILNRKNLLFEAAELYKHALELKEKHRIKSWYQIEIKIARIYFDLEKYTDALDYYTVWNENRNEHDLQNTESNYHNMGLCYLHLEDYNKADFFLSKSYEIRLKNKDTLGIAVSYMDLANLYYVQYKDAEAIPLFKKGLQFAKQSKDPTVLKTAHYNMGIVEENLKNYKAALQHFKTYNKIQDSLKNSQRIWELAEQQKKIELQQKNAEITNLEKDKQIQQAALEIKNQQRNLLLSIAVGLLLIAILVAIFYRNSLKKNKLIQIQKESLNELNKLKDELFSVLAHDLRSPVHHLISVTKQMKAALDTKDHQKLDDLILYGSGAANKTYLMLDNLLHWVLFQNQRMLFDRENINVASIFRQIEPVFQSIIHMKKIDLITKIPDHIIAYVDLNSLKIIFRNLLDNAIKFTPENNTVFIAAQENTNDVTIQIKDQGVGMDPTTIKSLQNPITKTTKDTYHRKSTGLGLRLCVSFVKRNRGTLNIMSAKNKGTTITITLPKRDRENEKD